MAYTLDGNVLKHGNLILAQSAGRCHNDALAGVDAQGVEVLHACHGEAVVVGIANNLELNLLPTLQALLYEHLGSKSESTLGNLLEHLLVLADTASKAAEGVCATDHDGIAYLASRSNGILDILASLAYGRLHVYLVQFLNEKVAVLGVHDGLHAGAKNLHAVLLESAVEVEFGTAVQGCLSAEGQQDAVGALLLDNLGNEVCINGLEIHLVGNALTGLDGSHVGVDEHRIDALLAQSLQCL